MTWEQLHAEAMRCVRCPLASARRRVVFGVGDIHARLMLVGEGPGAEEDIAGEPFVGAAGRLLNRILESVGFTRSEVYIANVVQCRPPDNRIPLPQEVDACRPFLSEKLHMVDPRIVVLLGATATRAMLDPRARISEIRGQEFHRDGRVYVPTFHPSALLRDPAKKHPVWMDFQLVRRRYDELGSKVVTP